MKRYRRLTKKWKHRIRNCAAHNDALVRRGSITLWTAPLMLPRWYANERTGKPEAPTRYSDGMIQMALVMRLVFRLPLRALEGFLRSLVRLVGWQAVSVPDHTTFCRRQRSAQVTIPRGRSGRPLHLVVDSTGLKIFGEGEWKCLIHGGGAGCRWRKRHLDVDPNTKHVIACEPSADFVTDGRVLPDLLGKLGAVPVASVASEGDLRYRRLPSGHRRPGRQGVDPTGDNAVEWEPDHPRTAVVRTIREKGRTGWKQESGYHRRSLSENAFIRIKTLFGGCLRNRRFDAQCTEAYCRIVALNCTTTLRMKSRIQGYFDMIYYNHHG